MNNRDDQYLAKLRDYYAEHRVLPSYGSVAKLIGLRTTSAVAAMVNRMKATGHLESSPDRRLQPGNRFFERALADPANAGLPQLTNDALPEGFNIDAHLIDTPSRTVLLAVTDDSMVDAGLLPGDIVIVKKGAPASAGDIVVAIVDREYTIRFLAKDDQGFYLKPGNISCQDIRPTDSLELFGVVVGAFRKYS
jgi:SOS-response transcriptional repressor LexA